MKLQRIEFATTVYNPGALSGGVVGGRTAFQIPEYAIEIIGAIVQVTHVESKASAVYPLSGMRHGVQLVDHFAPQKGGKK